MSCLPKNKIKFFCGTYTLDTDRSLRVAVGKATSLPKNAIRLSEWNAYINYRFLADEIEYLRPANEYPYMNSREMAVWLSDGVWVIMRIVFIVFGRPYSATIIGAKVNKKTSYKKIIHTKTKFFIEGNIENVFIKGTKEELKILKKSNKKLWW